MAHICANRHPLARLLVNDNSHRDIAFSVELSPTGPYTQKSGPCNSPKVRQTEEVTPDETHFRATPLQRPVMSRKAVGSVFISDSGAFVARVRHGDKRRGVVLRHVVDVHAARLIATAIQAAVVALDDAGHGERVEEFVKASGSARSVADVQAAASAIITGKARPVGITVRELVERWTSGLVDAEHPGTGRGSKCARGNLLGHVPDAILDLRVVSVDLDDVLDLKRHLAQASGLAETTAALVLRQFSRALQVAVFPLRLRPDHPCPKGVVVRVESSTAKVFLYPLEERQFLTCEAVPLHRRVTVAFLHREGCRKEEAFALGWGDLDLALGTVSIYASKTSERRTWKMGDWKMGDDTTRLLRRWKATGAEKPFAHDGGNGADTLRRDLKRAGVDRAELYERSPTRQPLRLHDTRSGFITLALACGAPEAWICDRTGHRSSAQLYGYRRAARHAEELTLGWYLDAEQLIFGVPTNGITGNDMGNACAKPVVREREVAAVLPSVVLATPRDHDTLLGSPLALRRSRCAGLRSRTVPSVGQREVVAWNGKGRVQLSKKGKATYHASHEPR